MLHEEENGFEEVEESDEDPRPARKSRLKGTVGRLREDRGAMKYLAWKEVELEELTPLFHRQLIVGKGSHAGAHPAEEGMRGSLAQSRE